MESESVPDANGTRRAVDLEGAGLGLTLSLGGVIAPNFILHGDFISSVVDNPSQRSDGSERTLYDQSLNFVGAGIGVTYYIMPENVYLSAGVGLLQSTLEEDFDLDGDGFIDSFTSEGYYIQASIGKEWWISNEFALGAALRVQSATLKADDQVDFQDLSAGLHLSLTYN